MPPSKGTGHPFRLLGVYAALLAVIYALVFFTGDKAPTPKLGIDLQGGTRVTLTARTPDGSKPSQDSLHRAQSIIESRVNGLGVTNSEVVIDGDNIVVTVPGDNGQQARSLAVTAKLYIRPVMPGGIAPAKGSKQDTGPGAPAPSAPPALTPGENPSTAPAPAPASAPAPAAPEQPAPEQQPAPQNRVFPAQGPTGQEQPPTSAPATPTPTPTETPTGDLTPQQKAEKEIAAAKALRQSTDPAVQQQAMATLDCSKPDPLAGADDPNLPLVACGSDGNVYLLDKSRISGEEIANATSGFDKMEARNVVDLTFKSTGADQWTALTKEYLGKQIAVVLDTKVITAATVQGVQTDGRSRISGNFTAASARDLANTLKYGSLPLSFQTSEAESVSATLGLSSLRAGLLAGAIGLAVVLVYCLLYYRMLGFLAGFSLVASGVAVYGLIVLLGRWIGFTLDLAGIAGLIIGIGLTADSFVVFFERIKDEMREGRSFRSAVPRGWARAQRTNLSGKTVSLIASVVLYILAAGQVKGFAFTLGVTTVLDVIVLYLVTAPLMMLASRSQFWAKPSVNGLGAIQQLARERKAGSTTVKETARR
ncbi:MULTISPECIES: protein translocase subunit SecD [unclassified Nocardia]|uniref:protein translocase subunit SecD n=1 Tax=unclassified Nocardia TaxID=2637762 RepID=UPI001CE48C5F|nr:MULTISPECIES: protein translocase subunit SecD [unclassified Nocardia]